jgi:30S ribosomal protein S31
VRLDFSQTSFSKPYSTQDNIMGKGDKRTFKGKVFKGSHGKTRPGRTKKKEVAAPAKRAR